MARVERAAEDLGLHHASEVGREVELRHHIRPHPLGRVGRRDSEPGEGEPVRLHEVQRRVDVVDPGRVGDGGVGVAVEDVGVGDG